MKTAFRWFIFSVSHVEDFHGRAGRVEVWSFVFFQCIFLALAAGIDLLFTGFPIVLPIYAALTSIPSVLLFIRRLHDCGYSGWWVFPAIVPPICFFVMCWAPDPAQPNKYGTTERLPSKNLRAKTVPPLIDGIEYLTPPPMPFEPAVKRREELFEKEQKEIAAYTTDDGREVLIKQTMRYENKTQINRIEWHYFINGKFNSIQNLDMRMFFPQELDSYLEWNGFHIIHKYGGFEEEAFDDNSAKQIFVCQC